MKRTALFMMLVALLAVHTGCRASNTCCRHSVGCPSDELDTVPLTEPEIPAAETARRSIGDSEGADSGGGYRYDPVLPPIPEVDQEV